MNKIFYLLVAAALVIAGCVQQQAGVEFRVCANSIRCRSGNWVKDTPR